MKLWDSNQDFLCSAQAGLAGQKMTQFGVFDSSVNKNCYI
jgi:hypothetical protein